MDKYDKLLSEVGNLIEFENIDSSNELSEEELDLVSAANKSNIPDYKSFLDKMSEDLNRGGKKHD